MLYPVPPLVMKTSVTMPDGLTTAKPVASVTLSPSKETTIGST